MSESQSGCRCGCNNNSDPKFVFSCSGSADVGELSDQAARQLNREGFGKMFCLAGIGGRVSGIMKSTEAAQKVLTIDGCNLGCARKTLEEAGINGAINLCLEDIGFEKGSSEVSKESISAITHHAATLL